MKQGFKDIATRMHNASQNFIDSLQEQFGLTTEQAEKVLRVFRKAKAVKLDAVGGRYNLTHGAFWDKDVIQRSLEVKE